jgi:ParB family transcriptional regulator, chromosome partitioning protein
MGKSTQVDESILGFFGADDDVQAQIEELQAEIQRLKQEKTQRSTEDNQQQKYESLIEELREQLKQKGVVQVAIEEIHPNPNQPRETFTDAMICEMATSLEEEGQLDPIILLPGNLLFDGECRWRAAIGILSINDPNRWSTLDAVYLEQDLPEEELHAKVLAAGIRNALNPLDLAQALMKQCQYVLAHGEEEIVRILRNAVRRLERSKETPQLKEIMGLSINERLARLQAFRLDEVELKLFLVLMRFKQNPASVSANIFPKLKLSDDLKNAIRSRGLEVYAADSLSRINAKNLQLELEEEAIPIRASAIEYVIDHKLSKAETQLYVSNLIANYSPNTISEGDKKVDRLIQSIEQVNLEGLDESQIKRLISLFKSKAREMQALLKS